jgi:hypothetical protein
MKIEPILEGHLKAYTKNTKAANGFYFAAFVSFLQQFYGR